MSDLDSKSKEAIQGARKKVQAQIKSTQESIEHYKILQKEYRKNNGDMRATAFDFMVEKFTEKEKMHKEQLRQINELADQHWKDLAE
jgi:hypothetical protein